MRTSTTKSRALRGPTIAMGLVVAAFTLACGDASDTSTQSTSGGGSEASGAPAGSGGSGASDPSGSGAQSGTSTSSGGDGGAGDGGSNAGGSGGTGGDYARGVPHPAAEFGWDPLTYDTSGVPPVASCPTSVNFAGTAANPEIVRGGGILCDEEIEVTGEHGILEGFSFYNTESSVRVTGASYVVIRDIEHGGDNTGTDNGSSMSVVESHHIVYYQNRIHNLRETSGAREVDYHGFVPRNDDDRIWYLDNDVHELGGDSLRTGTNVSSLDPGQTRTTNVFAARNRFWGNGENPIDLKCSTGIVISENDLYGVGASVSSAGEAIVAHEDAQEIWVYDNHIHDVVRGIVTATSGGGAEEITVDGNRFEFISDIGVYNRGGGHATVTNNVFHDVTTPIETGTNGSTTTEANNTIE
jgi:hypothetical protein